ncbi:MAG TPA: hypothetical protein PK417_00430 [Hyphomonas sp.]|nr:hypothetical protein [Hyphomonas sp.]HRX73488.1 hypothetical protein [Hyphomonas sp.]
MRPGDLWLAGMMCLAGCGLGQPDTVQAAPEVPLAEDGTPCVTGREQLMAMDYWTFDQDPAGYQAVYARAGCRLAAADLIRDYHAALREKGEPVTRTFPQGTITFGENGEVSSLYWHEGQIRAFAGQTDQAASLFRKSIDSDQYRNAAKLHYAQATIAFLENDLDALSSERAVLAAIAPENDLNLSVVDGLIACFGRSYKDAYGSVECDQRPGRQPVTDP